MGISGWIWDFWLIHGLYRSIHRLSTGCPQGSAQKLKTVHRNTRFSQEIHRIMCKTRPNPAKTIIGRLLGRLSTDPDPITQPNPPRIRQPGGAKPAQTDPQTIQTTDPGQTNPPPYFPPYLRQPAPISGGGLVDQKTTTGAKRSNRGQSPDQPRKRGQTNNPGPIPNRSNKRGKTTRPNRSSWTTKRPANGPNDQNQPNPRKTQTTPQTGKIVKCALTNLAKPKKPRFSPGVVLVLRQFPIVANVKLYGHCWIVNRGKQPNRSNQL